MTTVNANVWRRQWPWQLRGEGQRMGLAAALAQGIAALVVYAAGRSTGERAWMIVSVAFALFALDRGLGILQTLASIVRSGLRSRDVYWSIRRPIQFAASLSVALMAIYFLSMARPLFKASSLPGQAALTATVLFLAFVLLRSLSLHEFDGLLFRRRRLFPRMPLSFVVEIVTAAIIVASAVAGRM
ncbi:MAG: hypothetical protein ABSB33_11670 [Tepidisphaeraceae bacterium]|jgi:hypothetical protein